jgi:hypothetical protein
MPPLAQLIAEETNVILQEVLLLRHTIYRTNILLQYGSTIEDYTLIQPINSRYDFSMYYKPPIQVVVAIANNTVDSVYLIDGIAEHGDNLHLGSLEHQMFEQAMAEAEGRQAVPAVKFAAQRFDSIYIGRNITGWNAPINSIAKFGDMRFETVELL